MRDVKGEGVAVGGRSIPGNGANSDNDNGAVECAMSGSEHPVVQDEGTAA